MLIELSFWHLFWVAVLTMAVSALSWRDAPGQAKSLVIAIIRMMLQLALIGWVLLWLFQQVSLLWVAFVSLFMVLMAGREVTHRQRVRFVGWWRYGLGVLAMMASSFGLLLFALVLVVKPDPWYHPQYAIPLLGMLLGNTMNGVAIGLSRMTDNAAQQQATIEARLALGERWVEATEQMRRDALHSALIPTINGMAAAGVVSLPGMMTGQILAGAPPLQAVKYQILIFLLIAGATSVATALVVWLGGKRLFDERQRLRLDRLTT